MCIRDSIHTNPENTVIGDRAYGTDAQTVSDMAAAFTKGLESEGVSATAKHFPGHGDTGTDSHDGMAVSEHEMCIRDSCNTARMLILLLFSR